MVKVVWTQRALNDIDDIAEFIAKDSVKYARLTVEKIISSAKYISQNPYSGRFVPETNDLRIREVIHGNYRIIFFLHDDSLAYILTIHHSSKNLNIQSLKH